MILISMTSASSSGIEHPVSIIFFATEKTIEVISPRFALFTMLIDSLVFIFLIWFFVSVSGSPSR